VAFTSLGYYRYTLNVDGVPVGSDETQGEYSTDFLARYAVSFIRSTDRPFFLYFAPYAPHEPPVPADRHADAFATLPPWRPPAYEERDASDKPGYIRYLGRFGPRQTALNDRYRLDQLRTLLAVDDAVASLVAALEETGKLGNTMIVFMSDNGVTWGEHRLPAGRKGVPYDEATRVPFVVRYDPFTTTARVDRDLVLNIDVAPTFAALARAGRWNVDGRSLLPLLRSGEPVPWRRDFLLEHLRGPPSASIPTYCGLRSRRFLYVAYRTGERELYDLERDPDLLANVALAKSYQHVVASLQRRLRTRLCVPPPPDFSWPEVLRRQAALQRAFGLASGTP
jgi:arylsulfatase A-like enzyme